MSAASTQSPPAPRQKACNACASAKVRCDKKQECSRCHARGIQCQYPPNKSQARNLPSFSSHPTPARGSGQTEAIPTGHGDYRKTLQPISPISNTGFRLQQPAVCNIDAAAIQNRWLKPFLADNNDRPKITPPGTTLFVKQILTSYIAMIASDGRPPPFIHRSHVNNQHPWKLLSHCFQLLRRLQTCPNDQKSFASELLKREMVRLFDQHITYDDRTMLCSFQAYLLYTMTLYLRGDCPDMRDFMMDLQQMASASVSQGTITSAELSQDPPDWESWVFLEAKRRTVYTMYLFDNLLCSIDNIPTFVATELTGLLAPAGKALWEAPDDEAWYMAYSLQQSTCEGNPLRIEELWPLPREATEDVSSHRQSRVMNWLQGVDEYGTMLFAITTASHG